jgi:hypothetical protein
MLKKGGVCASACAISLADDRGVNIINASVCLAVGFILAMIAPICSMDVLAADPTGKAAEVVSI